MNKISLHMDFFNKETGQFDPQKVTELFEIAKSLGITHYNTVCNQDVYPTQDDHDCQFGLISAQLAQQAKMTCSSFHFVGSVMDCESDVQDRCRHFMKRTVDFFSPMKPECLVVHPGTYSDGGFAMNKVAYQKALETWGKEKTYQILVDNLRYFGKLAQEKGINLAIENIYGGRFYSNIDELIELVETVNMDNVGYCLDIGHGHLDGVDLPSTIRRMSNKLYEVHMHDNNGKKDQHLPLGFGTINWIEIAQAFQEIKYTKTATFEFYRWPMEGISRLESTRPAVEFWRTVIKVAEKGYKTQDWQ